MEYLVKKEKEVKMEVVKRWIEFLEDEVEEGLRE
jgi:hypothetical protein